MKLAYYGAPVLRQKAEPIQLVNEEVRKIAQEMIEKMYRWRGCGLAANQVFLPLSIFVAQHPLRDPETGDYFRDEQGRFCQFRDQVYINPQIVAVSQQEWLFTEGCLSIPGLYEPISRPVRLTIQATNLEGERFEESFEGYEARIIFHENDHLNGVLFIDRCDRKRRRELESLLQKIKKKYQHH